MKLVLKFLASLFFAASLINPTIAQEDTLLRGWHHKDPSESIYGVGTDKAHELLKNRKSTKVVVAILDSGVDTDHEDLRDNIWVNSDEIPDNGIDDDKNGYVDDINGWNFLGNSKGGNVDAANLEITRIYRKLAGRFSGVKSKKDVVKESRADYARFKEAEKIILKELNDATPEFNQMDAFLKVYTAADSVALELFGEDYTTENVTSWEPETEDTKLYKSVLESLFQDPNFSADDLIDYHQYLGEKLKYHYNPRFVDRAVVGDDYENTKERYYGNNDVAAPHNDHGTHVAGIVGAVSDNDLGMNGICKNVELMVVRTVPNGDEFDKDVANAIRYAADNGAHIINMSFGKAYSPQVDAVWEAIKYAEDKNVLMIHGAGNDAANIDKAANYPNPYYSGGSKRCATWMTIGASSSTGDENLLGSFSNFGKKKLDLFAPGVQIYSAKPDDTYEFADGTSMAAPVVAGVAALIKSYFPEITAVQLRELLLESSNKYPKLAVYVPSTKKKSKLSKLSSNGGIVSAINAAQMALTMYPE